MDKMPQFGEHDDPAKMEAAQKEFESQPQKTYEQLDREKLYESLYQLADTWCPNLDEYEYREFFEQIKFRLKYHGMQDNSAYDVLT